VVLARGVVADVRVGPDCAAFRLYAEVAKPTETPDRDHVARQGERAPQGV
jgi:hypothetical protein